MACWRLTLARWLAVVAAVWPALAEDLPLVRPQATLPAFRRTPTIDGTIGADEWPVLHVNGLVALRGDGRDLQQPRLCQFWLGSDTTTLFLAMRTAVHPKLGAIATQTPDETKDRGEVIHDDAFELWVDNDPLSRSGGRSYQLIVNPKGAWFDSALTRATGVQDPWWRVDGMRQAHQVADGIWTCELAIPWRQLGYANLAPAMGMRLRRHFKNPWDIADWSPGVSAVEARETMALVRPRADGPVVQERTWQDAQGIAIAVGLANLGDQPLPLTVALGYHREGQPRGIEEWTATLEPGEKREWVLRRPFPADRSGAVLGLIRIASPHGHVYHEREVKWRPQLSDTWEALAEVPLAEAVKFDIAWHPEKRVLRWRADYRHAPNRMKLTAVRVEVSREADSHALARTTAVPSTDGLVERGTQLEDLADGRYQVRLFLDEALPATKAAAEAIFEQRQRFPWYLNDLGQAGQVIAPFAPVKLVTGLPWQPRRILLTGREYHLGGSPFWDQVLCEGTPLLQAPIRLEAQFRGKRYALGGRLLFPDQAGFQVSTQCNWTAGELRGTCSSKTEVDGATRYELTIEPSPRHEVEALELVIPLRAGAATLMHVASDGPGRFAAGLVPAGEGPVWHSREAPRGQLSGTFVPYLWVGNEQHGLAWFAASDRDWVLDPRGGNSAISLERSGDTVTMRIRLVQTPALLDRRRTIVFGLMATPAKLMPPEPRWQEVGVGEAGAFRLLLHEQEPDWGGELGTIFPHEGDFRIIAKLAAARQGQRDSVFFTTYGKRYPRVRDEVLAASMRRGDVAIAGLYLRRALDRSDEWRVFQDSWRGSNFGPRQTVAGLKQGDLQYGVLPTPTVQDYHMYYLTEFLRYGFAGVCWNDLDLAANANPLNGSELYVRPDGSYQPEVDIWQLRELLRRAATVVEQEGRPNRLLGRWRNGSLAPLGSWLWGQIALDGGSGDADFQDRYSAATVRAVALGQHTGVVPLLGSPDLGDVSANERRAAILRTYGGAALVHELAPLHPDPFYLKVRKLVVELGEGSGIARAHRYWDSPPAAMVTGIDATWILYRTTSELVLVLMNHGEAGTATLSLAVSNLGLPTFVTLRDFEQPERSWSGNGGQVDLGSIARHATRVYLLEQ